MHGGGPGFESPQLHRRTLTGEGASKRARGARGGGQADARPCRSVRTGAERGAGPPRRAHGGCLGVWGRRRTWPRRERPRGAAGRQRSADVRMGQPARGDARAPAAEHIGGRGAPGELKHLSTPRKREDSPSSGERTGRSPNPSGGTGCRRCPTGVGRPTGRDGRPGAE